MRPATPTRARLWALLAIALVAAGCQDQENPQSSASQAASVTLRIEPDSTLDSALYATTDRVLGVIVQANGVTDSMRPLTRNDRTIRLQVVSSGTAVVRLTGIGPLGTPIWIGEATLRADQAAGSLLRIAASAAPEASGQFSTLLPPGPDFWPDGGVFGWNVGVSMTHPHDSAVLRYTLDGSEPTSQSPIFESPLVLTRSSVVSAVAFLPDAPPSRVVRRSFVLQVPAPRLVWRADTFSMYEAAFDCALPKCLVRYTLDGKDPDSTSAVFSGAIRIPRPSTDLRAKAWVAGFESSPVFRKRVGRFPDPPRLVRIPYADLLGQYAYEVVPPLYPEMKSLVTLDGSVPTLGAAGTRETTWFQVRPATTVRVSWILEGKVYPPTLAILPPVMGLSAVEP